MTARFLGCIMVGYHYINLKFWVMKCIITKNRKKRKRENDLFSMTI